MQDHMSVHSVESKQYRQGSNGPRLSVLCDHMFKVEGEAVAKLTFIWSFLHIHSLGMD